MSTLPQLALREALSVLLWAAVPPLLIVAIFALTFEILLSRLSLREGAVLSLLRIVLGLVAVSLCAPFIGQVIIRFTAMILALLPQLGRS